MIAVLKTLNLVLRFGLELALLASLSIYCWRTLPHGPLRLTAPAAVPIIVMGVWASVVHGANVQAPVKVAVQVAPFVAAVVTLAALRRPELAATFAASALANAALMVAWGQ